MTNPQTPAVSVLHARKSFGNKVVLDDVSLNIMPGEVLSMIGPSGAGKSTMLRCMTLLDRYDSAQFSYGDLSVCDNGQDGRAIYSRDAEREARMRFGIVFQHYNLFPHYTVLKNITDAPIVVQKRDRTEVEAEAMELLRQLDLLEHANKVPCELSGGQQQRVADEATSALDPKLTADMQRLIRVLASEGMAVGIVTHEMGFAKLVSDRIAFLFDGEIAEEGPAEQVIDDPQDPRTRRFLSQAED